jgi:hypothetical protein
MAGWHAVLETGWLAGWFVKLSRGQYLFRISNTRRSVVPQCSSGSDTNPMRPMPAFAESAITSAIAW